MALSDLVRSATDPSGPVREALDEQAAADEAAVNLANVELLVEQLQESLADAQLAMDDVGWRRLDAEAEREFTLDGFRRAAALGRLMVVMNPLQRRGCQLRIAYVWGSGVQIAARDRGDDGQGQDVNAVVQAFLDDDANQATFTSGQAHEELERALATDGNIFLALWTNPLTGRVQVRVVPFDEVDDVIRNPEDRAETWYVKQTYQATRYVENRTPAGVTTTRETYRKTVYYPALGFRPRMRPKTIDGDEVRWDAPVLPVQVNRIAGWKFGIGDGYAAMFWARGYKEFLEDWARLVKALSRFAWRATAKTGNGRAKARTAFATSPAVNPATGAVSDAGAAAVTSPDVTLEAIPKTGATIDSESGKPLAAMVAAAWGVSVVSLLGDPGQTGARAVAETLDQPMQLEIGMRRDFWADVHRRVLGHVIDSAVKAPQGALTGTVRIDPVTGRETVTLSGDEDRTIDVDWPDLSKEPLDTLVNAIVKADETTKVPPLVVARLLLQALGVDDVDEILDEMTDDAGNFVDQSVTAGNVAVDAFRRGQDPAAALAGGDQPQE